MELKDTYTVIHHKDLHGKILRFLCGIIKKGEKEDEVRHACFFHLLCTQATNTQGLSIPGDVSKEILRARKP